MFSRYRKPVSGKPSQEAPAEGQTPVAPITERIMRKSFAPAKPAPLPPLADKEKKRKERLNEIKVELHKVLLENLNLAALETASEQDLRAEIASITAESLEQMSVVLNKEERQSLHPDLLDEVTGLGPLEPLLKDDTVDDILVIALTEADDALW